MSSYREFMRYANYSDPYSIDATTGKVDYGAAICMRGDLGHDGKGGAGTHTVLILCSCCARTVLILCSYCAHTVLILYSYYAHTVLIILYSYYARTLLILYSYYAHTVLLLRRRML
jgi:hypothetical protein